MKKFFTLICALVATVAANAASIDDLKVCKHSYVFIADDVTNSGTQKVLRNTLFADDFIFTTAELGCSTSKGSVDLSSVDANGVVTEEIAAKYGEYGKHLNTMQVKLNQCVIAMSVTAGSKLIIFYQNNNKEDRFPLFGSTATVSESQFEKQGKVMGTTLNKTNRMEWTSDKDQTVYIGTAGGDIYVSYIIVEAMEAPGTPTVKISDQAYDGDEGMWYRTVTCTPVADLENPTCCTYTLDGTDPTEESPVYTEPIKVYDNCTVKFQAFFDFDNVGSADELIPDATNDAIVTFVFAAPTVTAEAGKVTITAAEDGGTNYYKINDGEWTEGNEFTLETSAYVTAMTKYENGEVIFESKTVSKDVYVLNPITEKKVIAVTAGNVVLDEEATATSTTGDVYKVEGGEISADPMDFYVKNLTFGVVKDEQYQIDGKEAYIQMSNTTIDFELAESAAVTVVCSKNACKNITSATVTDRACKVQVDGTQYGSADILAQYDLVNAATSEVVETLDGNVVKFDLAAGHHQFQKYSGTGNIKIASITIEPGASVYVPTAVEGVAANEAAASVPAKLIKNGKLVIVKGNAEYNAAGAQLK